MGSISDFYNGDVEREDARLSGRSSEFRLTWALIQKTLKAVSGNCVLDLGGATGVYALPLAELGCEVCLADISEREVQYAIQKAKDKNVNISACVQDARVLRTDFRGRFDVVLCLGPLYHATNLNEIYEIISNLLEYVKDNGKVMMAFLSKDSKICDFVKQFDENQEYDIEKIMTHFYEHASEDEVFSFDRRGELPLSFVNVKKIPELFGNLNVNLEEIVCVDYINDVPLETPEKVIDFLVELGEDLYIKNGSHVIVMMGKGKNG